MRFTQKTLNILGSSRKFQSTTGSFVMCPPVRPSAWNNSNPTGRIFIKFFFTSIFRKSVTKMQFLWSSYKSTGHFTGRPVYIYVHISIILRIRMFQTEIVEKIKKKAFYNLFFFRKSCHYWDNVEKYCTTGQIADGNMAHAHSISDS